MKIEILPSITGVWIKDNTNPDKNSIILFIDGVLYRYTIHRDDNYTELVNIDQLKTYTIPRIIELDEKSPAIAIEKFFSIMSLL